MPYAVAGLSDASAVNEFMPCAMKIVRPALQADIDDCARPPAGLSRRTKLLVEFLDRIDRQDRARRTLHSGAVDDALPEVNVIVVDSVDDEVVVLGPQSVGAD